MKKYLGTGFLAVSFLFLIQSAAFAQTQSKLKLGLGLLYGDEPEAVGLQITGTYRINQKVEFAPDLAFYFPGDNDTPYDGYWAINLNGHYIFVNDPDYDIYALAGLNITTVKFFNNNHTTKLGVNLGLGSEYHLQYFHFLES